jgi:hypothetical protein
MKRIERRIGLELRVGSEGSVYEREAAIGVSN